MTNNKSLVYTNNSSISGFPEGRKGRTAKSYSITRAFAEQKRSVEKSLSSLNARAFAEQKRSVEKSLSSLNARAFAEQKRSVEKSLSSLSR